MTRPALIAVYFLAMLGTLNAPVQSAEPDNAEIAELRQLLQQSIDRIASLEAQVAELKKAPDRSVTDPNAARTRATAVYDEAAARLRRDDVSQGSLDHYVEEAKETPTPRSRRLTPRITAPPRIEPVPDKSKWQRLEIDGKKYYVVPADEIPGPRVKEADETLRRS